MPVKINNFESNIRMSEDESSGMFSDNEIERIVQIVMERIKEEQNLMERINEETRISNEVSKKELFD